EDNTSSQRDGPVWLSGTFTLTVPTESARDEGMDRNGVRVLAVSGRGKLMSFEFAAETGELRLAGAIETGGEGPSFAALHPGGRLAYVVNEGSDSVAVIDLDAMALLSVTPSAGAGPAHISVLPGAEGLCV